MSSLRNKFPIHISRRTRIWALSGIGLIIISPVLFCIYLLLQPSVTEQLFSFVNLPPDTYLPSRETGMAVFIDYSYVEDVLEQRFPVGAPVQEINTFISSQDKQCERVDQGMQGIRGIVCKFEQSEMVCSHTISLMLLLNSEDMLEDVSIYGWSTCL